MADQQPKKPAKKKSRIDVDADEIFQAPTITREPSSRQAKLGSNIVLRVAATGRPLPAYQWFHNGKKISGANTDRLTLFKVRRISGGSYHCEVKNHAGKAVSRTCMLSFFTQRIPKLVIGPTENNLAEGKPFVLTVVEPELKLLKDFKIYWTFNGVRIKGALGPELSIGTAKKKYEGEYKAIIAVGSGLETSNVARLTVVAAHEATPTKASPAPAPPAPKKSENSWEDSLFDPEDETPNAEAAPEPTLEPAPVSSLEGLDWNLELPVPEEPPAISPRLAQKKEFLENFLSRWQSHVGKKTQRAA